MIRFLMKFWNLFSLRFSRTSFFISHPHRSEFVLDFCLRKGEHIVVRRGEKRSNMFTRPDGQEGEKELPNPYPRVIFKFKAWFFAFLTRSGEKKRKTQRLCAVTYMSNWSLFLYVTQQRMELGWLWVAKNPSRKTFLLLWPHVFHFSRS